MTDNNNHRVQVFGLDGSYKRQWGWEGDETGQFISPYGIAVSEGEVLVKSENRVQVFK